MWRGKLKKIVADIAYVAMSMPEIWLAPEEKWSVYDEKWLIQGERWSVYDGKWLTGDIGIRFRVRDRFGAGLGLELGFVDLVE